MKLLKDNHGIAHLAILIVISAAAVGFVGYTSWNVWQENKKANESQVSQSSGTPAAETEEEVDPYANWKTYQDVAGRYSFKHPESWQTLKCANRSNAVYFGSSPENIGFFNGSDTSILCGGGTDFPPQAAISFGTASSAPNNASSKDVLVDDMQAKRYRTVQTGEGLHPKGFISVWYEVNYKGQVVYIRYNRWPGTSETYDTDPATEKVFDAIVTETLEFNN